MELTIFLVLAIAAAGGILGLKLKLPAGAMLGAMIAVAIFTVVTDLQVIPPWFKVCAQMVSGGYIGTTMTRESLRQMKEYVAPVFQASRLNVVGEETQSSQFSRMYSFLAERNTIQLTSSITPAYSLLRYGVGDSKSFALVFAAMCRNANLECRVVSGTKDGQSHFWNMICQDGVHYHVDLLRNNPSQDLIRYTDSEMAGYVWDFDDYPACNHPQANNLQEE